MNSWTELVPTFVFVLFWGVIGLGTILLRIVVSGPSKFFGYKKRDKRPACLDDPSLGEHKFAELDVRYSCIEISFGVL